MKHNLHTIRKTLEVTNSALETLREIDTVKMILENKKALLNSYPAEDITQIETAQIRMIEEFLGR